MWDFNLKGALKTQASNSGQWVMLPWDKLVYEEGTIPDAGRYVKIPEDDLEALGHARKMAMNICSGLVLLKDMQRVVNENKKDLDDADRSFILDRTFLNERVQPLLRTKIHVGLLAAINDAVASEDRSNWFKQAFRTIYLGSSLVTRTIALCCFRLCIVCVECVSVSHSEARFVHILRSENPRAICILHFFIKYAGGPRNEIKK